MALRASWGGTVSTQHFHSARRAPKGANAAGKSRACCKTCSQGSLPAMARWHSTNCTRSASLMPKTGDFSTRARDKSCSGDTSTSSSATRSCTSGMSARSFFSGCCAGMCSAANSACIRPRRSRLRANTMMSLGCRHRVCSCCANQRAAWRHSRVLRVSSAIKRGVVRLSRQPGMASSPSAYSAVVATFETSNAASRSMRGNR